MHITVAGWLCALAGLYLGYVVAVYPILLRILVKFKSRPIRKEDLLPTVALVIPVRNGDAYLERKLENALALDYPRGLLEVVVVSDGSTDETDDIARNYASWDVKLVRTEGVGRAAALNEAVPTLRSSIVVLTDVRQELDRGSVREVARCFGDPAVGVVSGEVSLEAQADSAEARIYASYQEFRSWVQGSQSHLDSMLEGCGPFYAIRRRLIPVIPEGTVLDDLHIAMSAFFRGFRVVIEPLMRAQSEPTPLEKTFREKCHGLAAEYQILRQYPSLVTACNRMRFHYLSDILGRLLMPFALIVIAATCFQLPSRKWVIGVVASQVLLYGLAAIDGWVPDTFFLKKLTALARMFVSTMIAELFAIVGLFRPVAKAKSESQNY